MLSLHADDKAVERGKKMVLSHNLPRGTPNKQQMHKILIKCKSTHAIAEASYFKDRTCLTNCKGSRGRTLYNFAV